VPTAARAPSPDPEEPARLAQTVADMKLGYAVLTTVCRDDLPDQGSAHLAACITAVKACRPTIRVEILLQDFRGDIEPLKTVLAAGPDALGHNLETVKRLTPLVRDPRASYALSLKTLSSLRSLAPDHPIKSSLMLGLGETSSEIEAALNDLRRVGVDRLTLGQYLRPSKHHLPVERFIPPEEFALWAKRAERLGFRNPSCGPLVRSSYHAAEAFTAS
jgi:lipoic acid synthetase